MWTASYQHNKRGSGENGYKGIPIFAGYNLHEKCFEVFERYAPHKNAKILILGAGSGAFDQRLLDNGYHDLVAVEYYKEMYIPKLQVLSRDLNQDFSSLGKYDAIVAIEIIEHLENQFHFMREISQMLNEDGIALVTTPNVESPISRIKFFLRGYMSCFSVRETEDTGHINPVFDHIFRKYLQVINLSIIEKTYSTSPWDMNQFGSIKQKCIMLLFRLLSLIMKKPEGGQLSIYICRKVK